MKGKMTSLKFFVVDNNVICTHISGKRDYKGILNRSEKIIIIKGGRLGVAIDL